MRHKKLKWYGIILALLLLFLYSMGTYDIFMMLGHNKAYYLSKGFGQNVHEYFTNYPIIGLLLWVSNLLCGLLSPILYLCKSKYSAKIAFVSFASDLLLIVFGALWRERLKVFSSFIIGFDIGILVMTLLFGLCAYCEDKQYTSRMMNEQN